MSKLPSLELLSRIAARSSSLFPEQLRIERAQNFIRCAQHTENKDKSTSEVCLTWSDFADDILKRTFEKVQAAVSLQTQIGIFAYGKLGARELNLSSDIDLVLVSAEEDPKLPEWIRLFRQMIQDQTEFGFVFRLDFDLRPGGRMGSLIPTISQFEDYFSNYGEAWERLAFVRFRGVCGDPTLLTKCTDLSKAFTYRKHLDFTLLEDLKVLRQRIFEQNWKRSENGALDLKLGLGGIRDLELFVHTQQVIHGGRDQELRIPSTDQALRRLADKKILSTKDTDFLIQHYWDLRHFENLLQAATDQQIQVVPKEQWLDLITNEEREVLRAGMQRCQDMVSDLLGPVDVRMQSLPETEEDQKIWLSSLGYSTDVLERIWIPLIQKNVLSRQPERDELYRKRFLYEMTLRLSKQSRRPDLALETLFDFLKSIRAKATFFHLLLQKPELMDRLALLFSSSTYLSRILIQRPELLDSFLYQVQESQLSQEWEHWLSFQLEKKLLTEMSAGLEFFHSKNLKLLLSRLSSTADEIVTALLLKLRQEQNAQFSVIAMGKWGGRELGLHSDLDLVFVTKDSPTEEDVRAARRLISRLTEVQKGGSLYQLDFRLKPQGKGGLLLTSESDLLNYLSEEAQSWERQAYLKARPLQSDLSSELIWKACLAKPLKEEDWQELEKIHQGLLQKSKGLLDFKYQPGGLVETEFIVQLHRLQKSEIPSSTSTLEELELLSHTNSDWKSIYNHYVELRLFEQSLRLITTRPDVNLSESPDSIDALAQLFQLPSVDLPLRMQALLAQNAALLRPLDPRSR